MTTELDSVNNLIKSTMKKGSGGEISESDVEAILFAIKNDPEADAILLIGDNYSNVRDLELLKDVDKKVHVIVCAAPQKIRVDYLNIVRSTGGHLLWSGQKIDLSEVEKGEIISLGNQRYKFNGKVFKIEKSKEKIPGT